MTALRSRSVVLDVQGAQNRAHFDRGIPRYVVEQLRSVLGAAPEAVHSVALNPARPLSGNLLWLLGSGLARFSERPDELAEGGPLIYHVMSPFELERPLEDVWPVWARGPEVRTVVTLYDLIPLVFRDHYLRDPATRSQYLARAELVRHADHVLAISRATANDAVEHLRVDPARITVINAGVSSRFAEAYTADEPAWQALRHRLPHLRPGFMLYVSGIEFRKNNGRLIAAYGRMSPSLREAHQLVIACRVAPTVRHALEELAATEGVAPGQLVLPGYVSDAELAALYRLCRLFVFASFYEGSGLPILEAMAAGAPVAASRTSTFPEILGDTEATFDPFDPADMASCLERVVADDQRLARLRDRSRRRVGEYTWERVGDRTLAGYEAALDTGARRTRRARPRLAWISPWPPEQSGVATYSDKLVTALTRHADVDVFVGRPLSTYESPRRRGVGLRPIRDLAWAAELRAYDAFVYSMGNSEFHEHVYEELRRRPGVVIAHDVRLVGFYGWYAGREHPHAPVERLAQRLQDAYAPRIDAADFVTAAPSPEQQTALGLFLTEEVQRQAEHIIVHSQFAADVLRLDRRAEWPDPPPITVLPLAFELHDDHERRAPEDAPTVVSFGVLSAVKGLATLIDAFALVVQRRPQARLVLAGPADPPELERWRRYAAEAGVGDRVEIPGFVPREAFGRLLRTATLAVQLRTITNGEASAAVADCLGAGLPTIATDLGWVTELPDAVVERVPPEVTPPALGIAIERLLAEPATLASLSAAGREHAREHTFERVAERYLETLGLGAGVATVSA